MTEPDEDMYFAAIYSDDALLDALPEARFEALLAAALRGDPCAVRTVAVMLTAWREDLDEDLPDCTMRDLPGGEP